MEVFHHDRCRGLRLWKWGRTQWILWFAPKGAVIPQHVHRELSAKIRFLCGAMVWDLGDAHRILKSRLVETGLRWTRVFDVPAGHRHGGTAVRDSFFLVRETWLGTGPMTSAATDFHTV